MQVCLVWRLRRIPTPKLLVETILGCRVSSSFCSPFLDEQTEAALAGEINGNVQLKDTHTNMGKILLDLDPSPSTMYTFEVQVPTFIRGDGLYNIIGVATFFVGPSSSQPERRYDIAKSIAREGIKQYVSYSKPPVILPVGQEAYVIAYLMIGISAAILVIIMITLTIKHYHSQVMQICQAPFLLTYQLAALMAVLSSILMEAKQRRLLQLVTSIDTTTGGPCTQYHYTWPTLPHPYGCFAFAL